MYITVDRTIFFKGVGWSQTVRIEELNTGTSDFFLYEATYSLLPNVEVTIPRTFCKKIFWLFFWIKWGSTDATWWTYIHRNIFKIVTALFSRRQFEMWYVDLVYIKIWDMTIFSKNLILIHKLCFAKSPSFYRIF